MSKIRFVGLDVHADTIAVAVAEPGGEVRSLGIIANKPESVRKMIGKLGPVGNLKCCYEAGPTGYVLYWQLTQLGVACEVIAPSLVPVKAGDRVKDRSPAEIRTVIEALKALRGLAQTTAATAVCELGSLAFSESAPADGLQRPGAARAFSSGNRMQRGAITKTGNAHLRRVLRNRWAYQHWPNVQGRVLRRQKLLALSEEAKQIAWKAQQRLHKRFVALSARGKHKAQIVTALARELLGFM
jgi:transposase